MKRVNIAIIGAGQRGEGYANYVAGHPYEAQIVAVAERDPERREKFRELHHLSAEHCFADWHDLLAQPVQETRVDAVLVCTQDRQHYEPALAALNAGYHVLLEKPMSPDAQECVKLGQRAQEVDRIFSICHVLRYTTFFSALKRLLEDGAIGRLVSIVHNENIAFWHYAHSYVRGNWRNTYESSPIILAKSCHDMDILLWLVGTDCRNLSSFGSLSYFTAENAPPGAPLRCLDGCPAAQDCAYYAPRLYLTGATGWPVSVVSVDTRMPAVLKALAEGPYGRCVYHCDNDVVDHQVVTMEFTNGVTAVFTLCAFTQDVSRTIKLMGTKGQIEGIVDRTTNRIEISEFATGKHEVMTMPSEGGAQGHGGGDAGIMRDFLHLVRQGGQERGRTSAAVSVQSHLMAFAAEESRLTRQVVNITDFTQRVVEQASMTQHP